MRDPKYLARSACRYLQPTGDRMAKPLPTESQRYSASGLFWISPSRLGTPKAIPYKYRFRLTMISLSLTLERGFDDYIYITIRRLNQWYLKLQS